jgi:glycosyltransferase involved in cell wall biosynthesis
VCGSSVHPLGAFVALLAAKIRGAIFIFEIRDLWPETLIQFGKIRRKSLFARILFILEKITWNNSDAVMSPLAGMPNYGTLRRYEIKQFLHLPNNINAQDIQYEEPLVSDIRRVAYFGSIGIANNLDVVLDACIEIAASKPDLPIEVHIFGDGELKSSLMEKISKNRISFVFVHDAIPREVALEKMQSFDALFIASRVVDNLYEFGASPNKLADYLGVGRAILTSLVFPGNPVVTGINGFCVENSVSGWVDAFTRFCALDEMTICMMGRKSRNIAEKEFNLVDLSDRTSKFLESLAKRLN